MKRLHVGRQVTKLDGTPYVEEFDDDGNPVHWTIRTLLIDTIQEVAMLSTPDSVVIWKIGLRLVDYSETTIDLENADYSKLQAAYNQPQALLTRANWVRANIGLALEAAEDIDPDEKPKK